MNFEYTLSETKCGSLVIHIKPNPLIVGDYEPLEICLDSDISENEEALIWIDDVLNGDVKEDYCGGDIACAEFDKETTVAYFEISPNNPARCTLPTWLFREIVEVWLKEAKKHFEERRIKNG